MLRFARAKAIIVCSLFVGSLGAIAQTADKIQTPRSKEAWQTPGKIQTPGEIQTPRGTWQTPGKIQVPGKIQGVEVRSEQCKQRLLINADTLFEFDKASLSPKAANTLQSLVPAISKFSQYPIQIEGHTDSVGSATYNQDLSEKRAKTVRDWLANSKAIKASATIQGFGDTKPIAPNTYQNGADNPAGRQKNRRVEVVVNTCH